MPQRKSGNGNSNGAAASKVLDDSSPPFTMPMDSSSSSHARRSSRKLGADEDVDLRRARGEISCAECRRLKLKCDKQLPCSSCVRRGCASICPNGSLSTGQGTRFVLADTAQLHAKINEMGQRIRQLEDALAVMQVSFSNEPHPLLRDELLGIKLGLEEQRPANALTKPSVIDAMGTLTLTDKGEARYFGPSAGSETLLLIASQMESTVTEDDVQPSLSIDVLQLSDIFPFGSEGTSSNKMEILLGHLPIQARAWSLCETYLEHMSWSFSPLKRDEIVDDYLTPIYKWYKGRQATAFTDEYPPTVTPHRLAVLFMIFALGAMTDLTLEPYNSESETYHLLARAALSTRSVYESPEIATVQAILLMAIFHGSGSKRHTIESSWLLFSFGAKLSQTMGLHRDCARWNMDAKTVQRRRSLFWEIFSVEHFYSLALGRPPSIRLSYVDCEYPEDEEARLDENGSLLPGFYQWKYEFSKEVLSSLTELTLTAESPQYQTVLDLDRKVRGKTLPKHLNVFMSSEDQRYTPSTYMRGCLLAQYRTVALLYIHRSFFAQALLDHPDNPLKSPYAPSLLAAYRCASGVIKANLNHFERFPDLCYRWWSIWTHAFSGAIIMGSIVSRAPSSSMARSAYLELNAACDLFEKGSIYCVRARSGYAILSRLRDRASQVFSRFQKGVSTALLPLSSRQDYGDDELALFGGQTRVLGTRLVSSHKSRVIGEAASIASPAASVSSGEGEGMASFDGDVHPSLVQYLSSYSSEQPQVNFGSLLPPPAEHIPIPLGFVNPQARADTTTVQLSWNNLSSDSYSGQPPQIPTNSFSISPTSQPVYDNLVNSQAPTLMDYDLLVSGDSGMDTQWTTFMRDTGLLERTPARQMGNPPSGRYHPEA